MDGNNFYNQQPDNAASYNNNAYGTTAEYVDATTDEPKKGKGLGITAMILGIASLVLTLVSCCFPILWIFTGILAIVGIVFAIISFAKKSGKGMGVAGLLCSIATIIVIIVGTVLSILMAMGMLTLPTMFGAAYYTPTYYDYNY